MSRSKPGQVGFTMPELLVAVVIVGILAGLMIDAGLRDWRRERVNTVAIELAGWLESVRRAALKGNSCRVQIVGAGGTPLEGQEVLAQSTPVVHDPSQPLSLANNCLSNQPPTITTIGRGSAFRVRMVSGSNTFTFTPAGTLSSNSSQDTLISVALDDDHNDPQRCVYLEGLLGLISVGRLNGNHCDTNSRF